ncbi:uncharacterized protein LOC132197495 [Neocloeon triangulifer]|uniref:uncharacterized protein LOC132197495 n=1 Tax=Neocloeon triangulifer TaxID=2078957 RepID=UPI00286F46F9|nr:uncharacterized protein LOC132197495 [Neocloeon triangulifer]
MDPCGHQGMEDTKMDTLESDKEVEFPQSDGVQAEKIASSVCLPALKRSLGSEMDSLKNGDNPIFQSRAGSNSSVRSKAEKSRQDSHRIRSIRESLQGVPPPPSMTNPRISVEEALESLKDYFDKLSSKSPESLGLDTSTNFEQPEDLYLDIYYNDNLKCETLDFLYEKVRQRYIMNETSAFVTTASKFTVIASPLSCDFLDMLPRSMSSPASPAPDNLSVELAQRRSRVRANVQKRKSPRKTSTSIKNPGLHMNSMAAQRDVFLMRQTQKEVSAPKLPKTTNKLITVPMAKSSSVKETLPKKTEEKNQVVEKMTEHHLRKLLWATVQSLKATSPDLMEDSDFYKKCKASLYRLSQVQWVKLQKTEVQREEKPTKGTSDRMLELTMQLASQVVNSMTTTHSFKVKLEQKSGILDTA